MGGNIKNYYFNKIDARVSDSEFYDFFLVSDEFLNDIGDGDDYGDILITEFDFNNPLMVPTGTTSAETIYSLTNWVGATNTGTTLSNIGLTGLDNGLLELDKLSGDTNNTGLTSTITGTTLEILSGETSFFLSPVSGYTGEYIYPIDILSSTTVGTYAQLCGGFYQGFYKIDNSEYQTLPNRFEKGWTAEFLLNKNNNCLGKSGKTLNDEYLDNEGFFYYLGTRAENKYWTVFDGLNSGSTSGCTSGCTQWYTPEKETEFRTKSGYPLSPPALTITDIENNFLIYSRSDGTSGCSNDTEKKPKGKTVYNYTGGGITTTATTMQQSDFRNPFLIYSRADGSSGCSCSKDKPKGETICSFSGMSKPIYELDYEYDLVNSTNVFGLRIKDDGSIGYRALRHTCITGMTDGEITRTSGITVEESYSVSGMVNHDEWTHVVVKFVADIRYDFCKLQERGPRNGKLMFYVNGKLKFVVNEFEEVIPKRLNEWYQKQEAVPFNISLGGGSQGLLESLTFDGQDPDDLDLPIEKYFAGTFIGGISKFKLYSEPLSWCDIKYNYETSPLFD